jgi:quinol monooxygenase YgiN
MGMVHRLAQYRVRPDKVEDVKQIVATFIAAIAAHEPQTIYHAYQAEDHISFLHVMSFPDEAAEEAHSTASYTQRFAAALYPVCESGPSFTFLSLVQGTGRS